jgi:drug/metabolite transporter (DMT)-like permease
MPPNAALAAGGTIILWASAFPALRFALSEGVPPLDLAFYRFLSASLAFGVMGLVFRIRHPRGRDWLWIVLLAIPGITIYHLALNVGQVTVLAGSASFIIGAVPVFTTLIALLMRHEEPRSYLVVGMVLGFGGVILVSLGEEKGLALDPGAAWIVLAAFATSVYFAFQKPVLKRLGPISFMAWSTWIGTAAMMPFISPPAAVLTPLGWEAWVTIIYLGVLPGAVGYIWWSYALTHAAASQVTAFVYVSPLVATFVGWIWLGEIPTWLSLAGGLVSLVGVIIVQRMGRQRRTSKSRAQ